MKSIENRNMQIRALYFFALFVYCFSPSIINAQCNKLLWSDEFNGDTLDITKWNYDNGDGCPNLCQWGNNELQYYRSENIKVANGNLIITAKKENFSSSSYTSGKIITRGMAGWTYGRFEARMKLPKGQGIWPAFWMLSTENKYGGWPNSGEIDIMELLGHEPNIVHGTVIYGPPYSSFTEIFTLASGDFSDDFHLIALEWGNDTFKWSVDNVVYSVKTKTQINPWAPFDEEFYLILNLAVGGNWPGNPDTTTIFPQTMEVDYVRVYGQPSMQRIKKKGNIVKNAKGVNFSVSDLPSAGYKWNVPADATIESGQGTASVNVNLGCSEGYVSVTIETDCDTALDSIQIKFDSIIIAGDTLVFPSDTAKVYSIPALNNTTYSWSAPDGATIVSEPQDSNSIKLNLGCMEGSISVKVDNTCETKQITLPITFKVPELQGLESVVKNAQNVKYSIQDVPFAKSYNWSVPSDATIADGQGTNEILVNFGNQPGNISVEIPTNCDTGVYSLPVLTGADFVFCSFEGTSLDFQTFADTKFERISNPFKSGINNSAHIGKTYKSTTTWAGIYADLNASIDFSVYHTIKMKVYGPKAGMIKVKIENGASNIEKDANLTEVNTWQELSYNFAGAQSNFYNRLTLFFDFGSADVNDFYFDDIVLTAGDTSPTVINNESIAPLVVYPIPTGNTLNVKNLQNVAHIDITDITGRYISGFRVNKADVISCDISTCKSGVYFIKATTVNGVVKTAKFIKE